jgi:hypothetical protein
MGFVGPSECIPTEFVINWVFRFIILKNMERKLINSFLKDHSQNNFILLCVSATIQIHTFFT